jgi:hypothetical protein
VLSNTHQNVARNEKKLTSHAARKSPRNAQRFARGAARKLFLAALQFVENMFARFEPCAGRFVEGRLQLAANARFAPRFDSRSSSPRDEHQANTT